MPSIKILVIDDHFETLNVVRYILEQKGFEIFQAQSGQEGIEVANERQPDLILLDVMMPEMNGFEVCRILRSNPDLAQVPIIMFTARAAVEDKWAGFEVGADDYLTKPTDPVELTQRIKALLARKSELESSLGEIEEEGDSTALFSGTAVIEPRENEAADNPRRFLAIIGARGGSGATTVAINLAMAIADETPTTLIDLDMEQGHVARYLNHNPLRCLNDLASLAGSEMARKWPLHTVGNGSNLQLLLARPNLDKSRAVLSASQLPILINAVLKSERYIVADAGRPFSPLAPPAVKRASQVIICAQPDRVALLAARDLLRFLPGKVHEHTLLHVVLVAFGEEKSPPKDAIEEFLGYPLTGSIFLDRNQLAQAVNHHKSLVRLLPDDPVASAFRGIAKQVLIYDS